MQQTIDSIIQKHYKRFILKAGDKVVCTDKNLFYVGCSGTVAGYEHGMHIIRWDEGGEGSLYRNEFDIIRRK